MLRKINYRNAFFILLILLFLSGALLSTFLTPISLKIEETSPKLKSNSDLVFSNILTSSRNGVIYINDFEPENSWNITKNENSWLSGNGTINNPYIIQSLVINANSSINGILIYNSNVHFIIRNCTFTNSKTDTNYFNLSGIQLINTSLGTITDCKFFENDNGIILHHCRNINITNNTIYNNDNYAIRLQNSSLSRVVENTIDHNFFGVFLNYSSNNNSIIRNSITNNDVGLNITNFSNYNYIFKNKIINNGICIYEDKKTCVGNIFLENTCRYELPNIFEFIIPIVIYSAIFALAIVFLNYIMRKRIIKQKSKEALKKQRIL
ncbi:MAG: right-handed parallel beta-helix repeat-containing protein [Candidatus Lokiarchaeota archaeon]